MVKSIIKRIIVGVGIALILMFCKEYILLDVHAQDYTITPTHICAINTNGGSCNFSAVNTYQAFERPTYGNKFGSATNRGRIIWRFDNVPHSLDGKYYDLNFILYTESSTYYEYSNRGYFQGANENIYSCQIDNTKYNNENTSGSIYTVPSAGTAMVHCNNVYIDSTDYYYFMLFDVYTEPNSGGIVGISKITLTENVDSKTAQEIEEVNENITSEDSPDTEGFLSDIDTGDDSNTPVSDLITMPISLLQAINNNSSSACSTWNLGSLLGHNLTMPCINLQRILGSTLYNLIDMAICLFLAYNLGLMCITIYNNLTSLKDDFEGMYHTDWSSDW